MIRRSVKSKDYYNTITEITHKCGDIWKNLPTIGLLNEKKACHGIVITPACDVQNYKSETITYLPIISIEYFLLTPPFQEYIRQNIINDYNAINREIPFNWIREGYIAPRMRDVNQEIQFLKDMALQDKKNRAKIEKIISGFLLVRQSLDRGNDSTPPQVHAKAILGKKNWDDTITRIIKNSSQFDTHFLPALDSIDKELTLSHHSIALLRYPITLPIQWLDEASSKNKNDWDQYINSDDRRKLMLGDIAQPTKIMTLNHEFRVDLISRFASFFSKSGSPDFSKRMIERIAMEITR